MAGLCSGQEMHARHHVSIMAIARPTEEGGTDPMRVPLMQFCHNHLRFAATVLQVVEVTDLGKFRIGCDRRHDDGQNE